MPEWNLAGPRYKYPVSSAELERRLSAVQAAMRDKGLDCCIAQTQSTIFDSITRYLTDSAANPYSTTLLIPAQGGLVLINHGVEMDLTGEHGADPSHPAQRGKTHPQALLPALRLHRRDDRRRALP